MNQEFYYMYNNEDDSDMNFLKEYEKLVSN